MVVLKFGKEIQHLGGKFQVPQLQAGLDELGATWDRERDPGLWQGLGMDLLEDLPTQTVLGFWDSCRIQ